VETLSESLEVIFVDSPPSIRRGEHVGSDAKISAQKSTKASCTYRQARRTVKAVCGPSATDAAKFGEYLNSFRALRAQGRSTARRNVIRDVRERTGMTFGYAEAMRFHHKAQEASEVSGKHEVRRGGAALGLRTGDTPTTRAQSENVPQLSRVHRFSAKPNPTGESN
jgi:hypothetical protein